MNLEQTVATKFEEELTKLNYKHMDKLDQIVSDYLCHLHENYIVEDQHVNLKQYLDKHIKHRAVALKEDENEQ